MKLLYTETRHRNSHCISFKTLVRSHSGVHPSCPSGARSLEARILFEQTSGAQTALQEGGSLNILEYSQIQCINGSEMFGYLHRPR